jgi:hypothetical protein
MKNELCVSCYEEITDPICLNCNLKHFDLWLKSTELPKNKKSLIKNKTKSIISKESLNEEKCILCKKNPVEICFSCLFSKIKNTLEKSPHLDGDVLESFDNSFNYSTHLEEPAPLMINGN